MGFFLFNFEIINISHLTVLVIDGPLIIWALDGGLAKYTNQISFMVYVNKHR